jgi:signal transduction histidine kinase
MTRTVRVLWGLLLGWTLLLGQQPAFRRFGLREGLPQSQVTALLEDRAGFIWVGTQTGGVARLGASGFKSFGAPEGLKARLVSAMIEDRKNRIWVASEESISSIQGESVVNFGPDQGLPAAPTLCLSLDGADRLLAGSHAGLFRKEGARFTRVPLPKPFDHQPIRLLARDRAQGIWMVGAGHLIARWDERGLRTYPLPPGAGKAPVQDLEADPEGRIWVLLQDRLLRMERGAWIQVPLPDLPPKPKMLSLHFDAQGGGSLIALGGDGLLILPPHGPAQRLTAADGLPRDRILVALRDRRNVLWVGSDGDGLAAQAIPGLWALDSAPGIPGKNLAAVMAICRVGPGRVLLASSTGLYQVDEGRGITGHWGKAQGLPSNELWCTVPDDQGGAWIGTDRGLARWRQGRVAPAGPRDLARTAVITLVRDQGRLLAGTERGLWVMDSAGRTLFHTTLPPEMGTGEVDDVLRYQGQLLLATPVGLWRLEGHRMVQAYPDAPFATTTVTCMTADAYGNLWVGTMKGLLRLSGGVWTTYGVAQGLGDDSINFLVSLSPDCMAVGHNRGVDILNGHTIQHLSQNQGLLSDETNHDGFMLDPRGRLWIGMIGGVNILDHPETFRNPPLRPPTILEARWPGGQSGLPEDAHLPPTPDYLEVAFDTAEPLAAAPLHYEAYLEGVDDTWRPIAQEGLALHYRRLTAGSYRLHLRVRQDGGPWAEARTLVIAIQPAWYETWVVRGGLALAALGLLGGIIWLRGHRLALRARALEETIEARTQTLARQNWALEQAHGQIKRSLESRLKLMDMVTHDLRSPLTSIMLTLDCLRETSLEPANLLDIMDREANRIEALVRNLLDQSRSETLLQSLKLTPTVAVAVTEGFEDVLRLKAEARGLAFHLEVAPETARASIRADLATLQQVMLNLFENALKFTPSGGHVGIQSSVDPAQGLWTLDVWDSGRGLDPEQIQRILQPFQQVQSHDAAQGWGLGLSICQDILEAHGGRMQITSEPGLGARFQVAIPLIPEGPATALRT